MGWIALPADRGCSLPDLNRSCYRNIVTVMLSLFRKRNRRINVGKIAEMLPILQELDGKTIVRAFRIAGHGLMGIVCPEMQRGKAEIQFSSVHWENLPLVCTNAVFLAADDGALADFAFNLQAVSGTIRLNELFVVHSDQGRFYVYANRVAYPLPTVELFHQLINSQARVSLRERGFDLPPEGPDTA